eukprot:scaffold416_cov329-Pavlova_lutheri.AAC.1
MRSGRAEEAWNVTRRAVDAVQVSLLRVSWWPGTSVICGPDLASHADATQIELEFLERIVWRARDRSLQSTASLEAPCRRYGACHGSQHLARCCSVWRLGYFLSTAGCTSGKTKGGKELLQ